MRKRLNERMLEVLPAMQDKDIDKLRELKGKVQSNLKYHENLTNQLGDVDDDDEGEREKTDDEFDRCMTLNIDAREMLSVIDECISEENRRDSMNRSVSEVKTTEELVNRKTAEEIENLKLEGEIKRLQLEKVTKSEGTTVNAVKLPKIKLPEFSGDVLEWPTFWDSYSSTIHENKMLSNVDKFKYLMGCLREEAKDTLRGFQITEAQYAVAVKQLQDRYNDKEFILHSNYDKLAALPRAGNTTQDLRRTFNSIETSLRSLEALGETVETNQLISMVKSKFPMVFHLKLEEVVRVGDWTMADLRKTITRLIVARERTELMSATETSVEEIEHEYTGQSLLSKDAKVKCAFCTFGHYSDECQKFKTVQQRKVQLNGRCFVCFSQNHLRHECKSQRACFYCRKKNSHHSALCPTKFAESRESREENVMVAGDGEEVLINIDKQVVMKTAKVCLRG